MVWPTLSKREKEVLTGLLKETPKQNMAEQMGISIRTVETYRTRLMSKLGVKSMVGLVKLALQEGLLQ